jgi:hypothetical protein
MMEKKICSYEDVINDWYNKDDVLEKSFCWTLSKLKLVDHVLQEENTSDCLNYDPRIRPW